MIHLITLLPQPYHLTLCRTVHESLHGDFMAWFFQRSSEDFPYRSSTEASFHHHYLSEVGFRRLWQELRADPNPFVILGGWSSPMTNKTLTIAKALRAPVWIWADHPHPRQRSWYAARLRTTYLQMLSRGLVSGFLACGQPTVEHLVGLGIARERIVNFPYWVEVPESWSAAPGSQEDRIPKPLRLIAIGRHVPVKAFDVAIRAVALANHSANRCIAQLMMVGDGPERARLEQLANDEAPTAVNFAGWLEAVDVQRALSDSDALVMTSKFDAYGVAVLEAMAAGRPVLASTGVIAARDRDEGTGAIFFHEVDDAAKLAEQIARLADDRELLSTSSSAARATAEKWQPERATAILREIYSGVDLPEMISKREQVAQV